MTSPGAGAQEPPRQPPATSERREPAGQLPEEARSPAPPERVAPQAGLTEQADVLTRRSHAATTKSTRPGTAAPEAAAPGTAPAQANAWSPPLLEPAGQQPATTDEPVRMLTRRLEAARTGRAGRVTAAPDAQASAAQHNVAASTPETVNPPRDAEHSRQMDEAAAPRPPHWPPGGLPVGVRRWRDAVGLAHIACWQVAAALVVMSLTRPMPVMIAIIGAAVALVMLTGIRWRGRWMYQWCFALLGYLTRRRRVRAPENEPPSRALLQAVARGARIETLTIGDAEVGVITHGGGATAVFLPSAPEAGALAGGASGPLPTLLSLLPPYEPAGPLVTAQLVVRNTRARALPDSRVACPSHGQLAASRVSVNQSAWVAVQVQRDVDYLSDEVLHTVLSNIVRRLLRQVRKQGQPLDPLTAGDLPGVISTVATLEPQPGTGSRDLSRSSAVVDVLVERWSGWQTRFSSHTTLRDLRDGSPPGSSDLMTTLAQLPATATTVSIAARRRDEVVESELVADVAGANWHVVDRAVREVLAAARRSGLDLQRLDGYQQAGITGVLPLGGFQPW